MARLSRRILCSCLLCAGLGMLPTARDLAAQTAPEALTLEQNDPPQEAGEKLSSPVSPTYAALYQNILTSMQHQTKPTAHQSATACDIAWHLWETNHQEPLRLWTLETLATLTHRSDLAQSLRDFHFLHTWGPLLHRIHRSGNLPPALREELVAASRARVVEFFHLKKGQLPEKATLLAAMAPTFGDNNIAIGEMLGIAGLLEFLTPEELPGRAAFRHVVEAHWQWLVNLKDLNEDANNYDSLGFAFFIQLTQLLGHEAELKSPAYRILFDRFRDIVSPAGLMAEYGDSYFTYNTAPMDRIFILEYAARLWNDPSYLYPVRKLYRRLYGTLPPGDLAYRGVYLLELPPYEPALKAPTSVPSQVTYRRVRESAERQVDKLILRTGWQPGCAMVLMDLYAAGSHAQRQKGPSIAYYEVDGVPLFHNMGRHNVLSALTGNLLWACPGEDFPGIWKEGTWFTMSLPLEELPLVKDDQYSVPDGFFFRNFPGANHGTRELALANLRLTGPAGVKPLADVANPKLWSLFGSATQPLPLAPSREGDKPAIRWNWNQIKDAFVTFNGKAKGAFQFSAKEYNQLALDLRYEGTRPEIKLRGISVEKNVGDQPLPYQVGEASVEQRGEDVLGCVQFSRYIQRDSRLTRQILLTREGCLLVRDRLTPGPSMEGWTAGELWQLYAMEAHQDRWLAASDDGAYPSLEGKPLPRRRMMVIHGGEPKSETLTQHYHDPNPAGRKAESFVTTYHARRVRAGVDEIFSLLVVPADPSLGTQSAAQATLKTQADGAISAQVGMPGGPLNLELGEKSWQVRR